MSKISKVVVDTSNSQHAKLRTVPIDGTKLQQGFWHEKLKVNKTVTIPTQYEQIEATGRLDNFRRVAGKKDVPFQGRYYNDSDVYKWLEAVSWSLAYDYDPELDSLLDRVIEDVAGAQWPDGYINTYFSLERADQRWTNFDLHEMYCGGHLIQAAVAHYRATGKITLLDVAIRFADHLCDTFGPSSKHGRDGTDGHPEIEMALVELYRTTGNNRYLEQAKYFVDVRGHGILGSAYGHMGLEYHQDHKPFREMREIVGHAVRALYLNCGSTDIELEQHDEEIRESLHALWEDMTTRKMYVTGGLGSRYEGESFGSPYELPNARAYCETCAAIASIMWNWRLLLLEGDPKYADLIEHTLYNAVLPGIAQSGDKYFYENPLADYYAQHTRSAWFECACCPPNIARLIASLPGYLYSTSNEGVWIHQYVPSTNRVQIEDEDELEFVVETNYPWEDEIKIKILTNIHCALNLRIPSWSQSSEITLPNNEHLQAAGGNYFTIERHWKAGDLLALRLDLSPQRIYAHPYVDEDIQKVVFTRGPIVFCFEDVDNKGLDPRDVLIPENARVVDFPHSDFQGVRALHIQSMQRHLIQPQTLYSREIYKYDAVPQECVLIPYFLWNNRGKSRMSVWLNRI